jgi:ribosomal protein S18 acetylase RimI-like enzyme
MNINEIGNRSAVATSQYSYDELVAIYNQTRVDYIVPMPMNARRLQDYVETYDVNLDASIVTLNEENTITGISMLGIRDDRSWITRLGVLPVKRRQGTGQYIVDNHIAESYERGMHLIQLEVIKNNVPAHQLFIKNGFEETRELLVIRRPPAQMEPNRIIDPNVEVELLDDEDIVALLRTDDRSGFAWTEETVSLINAGSLRGMHVRLSNGASGTVIFQFTPFQLTHFKLSEEASHSHEIACNLLYQVHAHHPQHDSKIENVAIDDPLWQAYRVMGYMESFRRIEMFKYL